jgi:hypothetical protein
MDEKSPVADLNAQEAKESIANMRSVEKLEQIALTDTRSTVAEAATKRLEDLRAAHPETDKDAKPEQVAEDEALRKELNALKWDGDYPLKSIPGNKALRFIELLEESDPLEIILHEDKRISVVDAAKARLRTTAIQRKREAARVRWGIYRVEYNGTVGDFKARNEVEAWALFNDANKTSFGPKVPGRQITKVRSLPPENMPAPEPGTSISVPALA